MYFRERMKFKYFVSVIPLLTFLISLNSCSDDTEFNTNHKSNFIGFSVVPEQNWNVGTAGARSYDPLDFVVDGLEDTIYLHCEVVDSIVPMAKKNSDEQVSRSTPVKPNAGDKEDSGNFADVHKSFGVSAYVGDVLYMGDLEVESSGDIWATKQTYFWPADAVNFYAYAPYYANGDENAGKTFTASGNTVNSYNGSEIEFTYTVPKGVGGENKDAEAQPDLMFAGKIGCTRPDDGTQPLNFAHAMAAVQFQVKNIIGCTINSITIKNVYGSYTCVYDVEAGTFIVKEYIGDADKSYTQNIGIKVEEENDGNITPITNQTGYETHTFMMLPQTLASTVEVEVNLTVDGTTTPVTISGSIGGNDASGNPKTWEAGKTYIYTISNEVTNWTYVFDVTPSITIPFYGIKDNGSYSVTSYKQGTRAGQTIIEPVEWEVVSYNDGVTEKPSWLDQFTSSGSGVSDANSSETYNYAALACPIASSTSHTNLVANAVRGSVESPFNLSNPTDQTSTEPKHTANCYIVNAPGYYKLPLIYGNGYNNPLAYNPYATDSKSTNTYTTSGEEVKDNVVESSKRTVSVDVYALGSFKDHNDTDITSPWIVNTNGRGGKYTPASACIVWQDEPRLLTDVKLSSTQDYIEFTVLADHICEGNAVIAVKDAGGNIMWSWHIWVSDIAITPHMDSSMNMPEWNYQNNIWYIYIEGAYRTFYLQKDGQVSVDANMAYAKGLGFCDGETKTYSRTLNIIFRQKENGAQVGNTKTMAVTQSGTVNMEDNACYYQWGRKDPMLPATSTGDKPYYVDDSDRTQKTEIKTLKGPVSLGTAIKNPDKFITGYEFSATSTGLGIKNWCEKIYTNLWNAKNTWIPNDIYDYSVGSKELLENIINGTMTVKTVYDPCEVGYELPRHDVWTGYTSTGSVVNGGTSGHDGLLSLANIKDWYEVDKGYGQAKGYAFYLEPNGDTYTIFIQALGVRRPHIVPSEYGNMANALTSSIICMEWQKNDGTGMNNYYRMEPSRLFTQRSINSVRPISTSTFDLGFTVIPARIGANPTQQCDADIEQIF